MECEDKLINNSKAFDILITNSFHIHFVFISKSLLVSSVISLHFSFLFFVAIATVTFPLSRRRQITTKHFITHYFLDLKTFSSWGNNSISCSLFYLWRNIRGGYQLNTDNHFDISFYLMLLHVSEETKFCFQNAMFSAFSSTLDPLDYLMIWHQQAVLEAVGVINSNDLHILHMSFVSQLLCVRKFH